MKRLSSSFVSAVYEAVLRSFWRRKALRRFLRQVGIAESFLATWHEDESKRDFLDRLFAELANAARGQDMLVRMARDLVQQQSFPDLIGWEDSEEKAKEARKAQSDLRAALARLDDQMQAEHNRLGAQNHFNTAQELFRRSREHLVSLEQRLAELATKVGSQEAGYEFQRWFYDLMDFSEITNRRPYAAHGRQFDGSVTISGTTYLVELKFTSGQAEASDIDTLLTKVVSNADNTMGVMVSIGGFTAAAIQQASTARTPLLLLNHGHLYLVLRQAATFAEIVERARRHASQTGEAYLSASDFEA